MPIRPPPPTSDRPYHITARCNNQEWFHLPLEQTWRIFETVLAEVSEDYEANVIAFVLMSNHYHLLLQTPRANIGQIMNRIQTNSSCRISSAAGRTNHLYGGPYKGCLITSEQYLANVYKYTYRNPIAVGLSSKVEAYPFSTLQSALGQKRLTFPVRDDIATRWSHIPSSNQERLNWLNTAHEPKVADLIKKGLRRRIFTPPRMTRKESLLFRAAPSRKKGGTPFLLGVEEVGQEEVGQDDGDRAAYHRFGGGLAYAAAARFRLESRAGGEHRDQNAKD